MYCLMIDRGAPPHEAAKYEGDQKCPCMVARFTRPVKSCRSLLLDTPLSEFTSEDTATLGGYQASRWT